MVNYAPPPNFKTPICTWCQENGHLSHECPSRKMFAAGKPNSSKFPSARTSPKTTTAEKHPAPTTSASSSLTVPPAKKAKLSVESSGSPTASSSLPKSSKFKAGSVLVESTVTTPATSRPKDAEEPPPQTDAPMTIEPAFSIEAEDIDEPLLRSQLRFDDIDIGEVVDALIMLNPEDNPSQVKLLRVFHPCVVVSKLYHHKQITGHGCSTFGNANYNSGISPFSFCDKAGYKWRAYSYLPMNDTVYGDHDPEWALHIPTVGKRTVGYVCTGGYKSYINFRPDKEVTEVRPSFNKAGVEIKTTISKESLQYILAHGRIFFKSHDGHTDFDLASFERRTARLVKKMRSKIPAVEAAPQVSDLVDDNQFDGWELEEEEEEELEPKSRDNLTAKRQHLVFNDEGSPIPKTGAPAAPAPSRKRKRGANDDHDDFMTARNFNFPAPYALPMPRCFSNPSSPPYVPTFSSSPIATETTECTSEGFTAAYLKSSSAGLYPKVQITLHRHGVLQREGVQECDHEIYQSICMGQERGELVSALGLK
ncbi:hypothetical protein BJ508DRAFT_313281 [Ascobolus immersus RN42]|uniref:CCHC-type domain-containing protein n=1 Tax=Ascobolus immersus RN42 TaxID=1160509 RepID=A0A3N4HNC0_ASCIM|nr:hypothetical protein BJ508DRAFT_313281 [Ascobolus immersus RN42]